LDLTLDNPAAPATNHRALLLYLYAGVLVAGALAFPTVLVATGARLHGGISLAILAGVAVLAERGSVKLSATAEISVASLVLVFAAVLFGPLAAMVVGTAALVGSFGRPYIKSVIWTSIGAIVAGAAGLVAAGIEGPAGAATASIGLLLAAVAAASLTEAFADLALGSVTTVIRGTGTLRTAAGIVGPLLMASVPLHTPVIALLAYAYLHVSPWSTVLFAIPAFAAHRLFLLYRQQRDTSLELAAANVRLEKANMSFATALVATLDARDQYTAGHSAAVAIYSRDIAKRMGLSDEDQQLVHLAGLVHDIGKVGLPAGLLEKPGALTLEERRQMERHAEIGERILANVDDYAQIASIVRHHHERVDGNGYPDGVCNEHIPLLARIISVADAYNAMTSDRPYREAMPSRVARLRLAQAVETQFDTSVVAAFEAILAGSSEAYRLASSEEFGRTWESTNAPAVPKLAVAAAAAVS
jgi:putative nucleotidyltransferase with HDIG domain